MTKCLSHYFFFFENRIKLYNLEFYAHKRSRWYMRIFMIFKHLLNLRANIERNCVLYSLHFICFFLEKQEIRVSIFFLIQYNELLYYLNVVQYQQNVHLFVFVSTLYPPTRCKFNELLRNKIFSDLHLSGKRFLT